MEKEIKEIRKGFIVDGAEKGGDFSVLFSVSSVAPWLFRNMVRSSPTPNRLHGGHSRGQPRGI